MTRNAPKDEDRLESQKISFQFRSRAKGKMSRGRQLPILQNHAKLFNQRKRKVWIKSLSKQSGKISQECGRQPTFPEERATLCVSQKQGDRHPPTDGVCRKGLRRKSLMASERTRSSSWDVTDRMPSICSGKVVFPTCLGPKAATTGQSFESLVGRTSFETRLIVKKLNTCQLGGRFPIGNSAPAPSLSPPRLGTEFA